MKSVYLAASSFFLATLVLGPSAAMAQTESIGLKLSLTLEPEPAVPAGWLQPAKISYSNSSLAGSSYLFSGAIKVAHMPKATLSGTGVAPYLAAQWARNSAGARDKQQDFRKAELGIDGQFGDDVAEAIQRGKNWFAFFPKVSVAAGRDEISDSESRRIEIGTTIASNLFESLSTSTPGAGFSALPTIALFNDRIVDATEDKVTKIRPTGKSSGVVAKIAFRWVPPLNPERFSVTATAQTIKNTSADGVRTRDTYRLYKGTLTWNLYSEKDTDLIFKPVLQLERKVGEDPYAGFRRQGITTLSLGVKGSWGG